MKNQKIPKNTADNKENTREAKNTLKEGTKDSSVKEALKKEKQPVSTDDLSNLQNNRDTGTSGGDQRASESEIKKARKTGKPGSKTK